MSGYRPIRTTAGATTIIVDPHSQCHPRVTPTLTGVKIAEAEPVRKSDRVLVLAAHCINIPVDQLDPLSSANSECDFPHFGQEEKNERMSAIGVGAKWSELGSTKLAELINTTMD